MLRTDVKKQQDKTVKTIQLGKNNLLYFIASYFLPEYNKSINKVTDITQEKNKTGRKKHEQAF